MKLIRFISVLFFGSLFVLPVASVATEAKSRHGEFSEGDRDPPFVCRQIKDPNLNLSKKRNGFSATNLSPAREYEDAIGEQNTLVVFVAFADQTTDEGTSELEEKAREALFGGEGSESAGEYFKKVSQGKMSLKGKILSGWRILKNSEEYGYGKGSFEVDHNAILKDTIAAIDDEVYFPDFTKIIIFMEGSWGYAMSSIGKWSGLESDDGILTLGICWIEKDDIDNKYTLRHEILHTFGGIHSGSIYLKDDSACERLCSSREITKADDTTWPPLECSTEEYGDGMCVLGHGRGYPSAFIKYKLGWLNDDQILVVTESVTATLIPRSSSLAGIKMIIIKAKDADGTTKTYFLEYFKRLTGFDSSNKNGTKVLVRFFNEEEELNDSGTILLLKKKETEEYIYYDPPNLKEESFCDQENGIEIKWTSEQGEEMVEEDSYAELQITLSCPEEKSPSVSVSPDYIQTMDGENITTEISVTNEMAGLGCGTRTVNVEASLPDANWSATFSPSSTLELGPGEAGTITAAIWVPETATASSYGATFKATDQDSGLSGEASMTIEVLRPPPTPTPMPTPTPVQNKEMILEISINEVKAGNNDIVIVSKGDWVRIAASVLGWYDEELMENLRADKITCQIKNARGKTKFYKEQKNSSGSSFLFKMKKRGQFDVEVVAYKEGYETASFQAKFKVE